jgi:ferredoxin
VAFIITDKCLGERYASCMQVCPVYCIYPGELDGRPFAVIDPKLCIDCGACVPECPVEAIIENSKEDPVYAELNEQLAPVWKGNPVPPARPATDPPRRGTVY